MINHPYKNSKLRLIRLVFASCVAIGLGITTHYILPDAVRWLSIATLVVGVLFFLNVFDLKTGLFQEYYQKISSLSFKAFVIRIFLFIGVMTAFSIIGEFILNKNFLFKGIAITVFVSLYIILFFIFYKLNNKNNTS